MVYQKKDLKIIFIIFIFGSFFGFILENTINLVKGIPYLRQGLFYEPLIPIYGIGALIYYFTLSKINFKKKNKWLNLFYIFLISALLGGTIEYILSFFQEKIFGTISWDYSYAKFNINGRTSLFHSCCWGLIGAIYYSLVIPLIQKLKIKNFNKKINIVILILFIISLFDISITALACYRKTERNKGIEANNKIRNFLDQKYPDDFIDFYFNNAKIVKK